MPRHATRNPPRYFVETDHSYDRPYAVVDSRTGDVIDRRYATRQKAVDLAAAENEAAARPRSESFAYAYMPNGRRAARKSRRNGDGEAKRPTTSPYKGGLWLPADYVKPKKFKVAYSETYAKGIATIDAKVGKTTIGRIQASGFLPHEERLAYPPNFALNFLDGVCREGYVAACAAVGTKLGYWIVDFVQIVPEFQRLGIGVELYVRAVKAAATHGCVLAVSACTEAPTSDEAFRVWRSEAFRGRVTMFGKWIAWGG